MYVNKRNISYGSRVLVLGSSSAIAEQIGRLLASVGTIFYLTARNIDRLEAVAADLRVRGAVRVETARLDVTDVSALTGLVSDVSEKLGGLDTVIFAAGLLPDQARVNNDPDLLRGTMEVNAVSAMVVLNEAAALFEQQSHGQIVAIYQIDGRCRTTPEVRHLAIDTTPVASIIRIQINTDGNTTRTAGNNRINIGQTGCITAMISCIQ